MSEENENETKSRRKHLDERLRSLYQRAIVIEDELKQIEQDQFYRVCIFGSARIKPETKEYQEAFELARMLAWEGIDILTGGGPGLMEAANKGAQLGGEEKDSKSRSFGLSIQLDFEPVPNSHLDVKRHHHKFSSRLDDFMRLSNAVIATPGGIGTLLELYFAWQLIQVKHMSVRPIVLMDRSYWTGLLQWMKDIQLERGLVSAKDFDCISIVDTPEEVYEIISNHHRQFLDEIAQRGEKA
ncbi:MAG: LOG family protein [Bdellovibrionales bacterium]|nr:LOG family protein [Bdellovibrionales bacterium]